MAESRRIWGREGVILGCCEDDEWGEDPGTEERKRVERLPWNTEQMMSGEVIHGHRGDGVWDGIMLQLRGDR